MEAKQSIYGSTPQGEPITVFVLSNGRGMTAKLINYGAILISLSVPDRDGKAADITLGYDTLDGWMQDKSYFGATVGRYANRIAKGRFILNGIEYQLATNNGENHLHGGIRGFNKVIWKGQIRKTSEGVGVEFSYLSRDGEEGYPGNLSVTVIYELNAANELKITYSAETDKPTPVNLTHHSYFNLSGESTQNIIGHELTLNADRYTPVDDGLIPTGELKDVTGRPMDFRKPNTIGSRIAEVPGGYDHNYVLNSREWDKTPAAVVYEPKSGRVMEIYTTEPGIQFYSGNFLDGSIRGKGGIAYNKHQGFCLEPQHFPDSPNKPQFPPTILKPTDKYSHISIYKFYPR